MLKILRKEFEKEVSIYGLFVSILILIAILFFIICLGMIIFFSEKFENNCTLKIAFASLGTFLASMGLNKRAKIASTRAGRRI